MILRQQFISISTKMRENMGAMRGGGQKLYDVIYGRPLRKKWSIYVSLRKITYNSERPLSLQNSATEKKQIDYKYYLIAIFLIK